MRNLTLMSLVLFAAPAFADLTPSHFRGALMPAAYYAEEGPSQRPVSDLTRDQLEREMVRLNSERPGLGLPIGFMAGGGAAIVVGLTYLLTSSGALAILAGVVGVAGGVFLVIGVVKLIMSLHRRSECDERIGEINARLDAFESGTPVSPTFDAPPPPPPPAPLPPGDALREAPEPAVLLASF